MENSFSSLVAQANSVLILLAKNPYLDQVAAGLSLYLALKEGQSKNVQIASSSPMMVEHNRLVAVDKVTSEPGNKNLVVRFSGYQADNIERVSYDVEGQEFRLTVMPKAQFAPPTKQQVELTYSGIAAELVILVGGMNESHFPMLFSGQIINSKIAHVGAQNLTVESGKEIISFAEGTASTCEITYKLLEEVGATLNEDIATNLLMGIQEGTKSFSHSRVTAQTFKIASQLMEKGARLDPRQAEEQRQYPPGSIPGQTLSRQQFTPIENLNQKKPQGANEDVQIEETKAPQSWLQPKIYKGGTK